MSAQASLNCLLDAVAGMRHTVERIAADYVPGEPIPGSELDRYRQDRLAVFEAADDARQSLADLIAERDALLEALREANWRLSCIGTPRDAQGRYHKDGEWTFGDALPNAADAREVAYAFALIRSAITTGESA